MRACLCLLFLFTSPSHCFAEGELFGRFEVLFWTLDSPNQSVTLNENTGAPVLHSSASDYSFESFPKLTAGLQSESGWGTELVYFGFQNWNGQSSVAGNNNLSLPGALPLATLDFFDADSMKLSTLGEMHNAEWNIFKGDVNDMRLLAGFRFFRLSEQLDIESTDNDSGTSNYLIDTSSDLYGLQFGLEKNVRRGQFGIRGWGKAGVFGGEIKQQTFVGDFNNTSILRDVSVRTTEVSFLAETGLTATFELNESTRIEGGYNVMWVENVARATDQLEFADFAASGSDLRQHGGALLHGANVSLVFVY